MRTDVHFAALRAAARVAFSMALLNACSSAAEGADEPKATGEGEEGLASSEAAMSSPDCPDHTCASVLAAEFPKPGDYRWEREPRSKQVVECCQKELAKHGSQTQYRWDCCVAFDPETGEGGSDGDGQSWACTPWGPPVPPSMERLAARRARRAAKKARSMKLSPAASREAVA